MNHQGMHKKENFWIPLDNAAKIYPAIRNKEHTAVIRLTAILKERITISKLFTAVARAEQRFPYFKVCLQRGFFWYYLEQVSDPVIICHDRGIPCRAFDMRKGNRLLLRILVHKNRVSAEFSHMLTDGYGVLTFLKAVLIYYFKEKGILRSDEIDGFFTSAVNEEEYEDAYSRYFKEHIPAVTKQSRAFHLPFSLNKKPRFDLLLAILPIEQMKAKARGKGVSITDYLAATYLLVLQNIYFESRNKGVSFSKKIARIQVPVNLRNIYPTQTMRNFSLFVMPELDFSLGKYTFDEILKIVYHKIRLETDEKLISKIISRNVSGERNLFVRSIPVWLKSLVLYLKYYSKGANQYSGVVSNLGRVNLPDRIRDRIDYFALSLPPPNKLLKINCGVIGYGNKLVLSFGNITNTWEFERRYLHFLSEQGIKIRITKHE